MKIYSAVILSLFLSVALMATRAHAQLQCGWVPATDVLCDTVPQAGTTANVTAGTPFLSVSTISDANTRNDGYDLKLADSNIVIDAQGICRYHDDFAGGVHPFFLPFRTAQEYVAYLSNIPNGAYATACAMPSVRAVATICGAANYTLPRGRANGQTGIPADHADTPITFTRGRDWTLQEPYNYQCNCQSSCYGRYCATSCQTCQACRNTATTAHTSCDVTLHQYSNAVASSGSANGQWQDEAAPSGDCTPPTPDTPVQPPLPTPVDGQCGPANGQATPYFPWWAAIWGPMCSSGNSTNYSGDSGGFSWNCEGTDGGATATCFAPISPACGPAVGRHTYSPPWTLGPMAGYTTPTNPDYTGMCMGYGYITSVDFWPGFSLNGQGSWHWTCGFDTWDGGHSETSCTQEKCLPGDGCP